MASKQLADQFTGLPMKTLIGAPLKAATDANAMIAQAQTQFLLSTCFEKVSEYSADLRPIMVTFQLSRQILDNDGQLSKNPATMNISIPLMTLIPINSLAVETLKISFNMEVKSSQELSCKTSSKQNHRLTQKGLDQNNQSDGFDVELYGTLSSQSGSQQKSAAGTNYEVTLEAGQLPLPRGVTTILDIFEKNLAPIPDKN
ncbi:DUF2589 domain-containing protein [Vibrio quintilis]|uniref:DUF2589 domain-containing protein n=1 Tax=Vibrio quintilis TaxID=1117707 RepID=A0A1M7Z1U8_9VIBR|nr:DUF2589 domain-containing protein [Vibrio quintilis]SHO58656.1 hypothetical protein VQ7734_04428 [Vibrio quintilis]